MNTMEVCEHLLYHSNGYLKLFNTFNIVDVDSKDRQTIACVEHKEFANSLVEFEKVDNLKVIGTFSLLSTVFIINRDKVMRKYPILKISGYETEKLFYSKTGIISIVSDQLRVKEFLPYPLTQKIVYVDNIEKMEGVTFSEFTKNCWTLGNPLDLSNKNLKETTGKQILLELLDFIE